MSTAWPFVLFGSLCKYERGDRSGDWVMDEVEVCLYSLVCRVMVICCGIGRLAWLDIRCTICSHGRLPMSEVDLLDSRRRKKTAGCINLFIVPSSIHR